MRKDIKVTAAKGLDPSKNSRNGRDRSLEGIKGNMRNDTAVVPYKIIVGRTYPFGAQAPVPFKTPHFPSAVPPNGLVLSNKKDGIVKTVPLCAVLILYYDCDCSGGFCG